MFIPIAEQTGLIGPIGHWVLEQAGEDATSWQAEGRPFTVNVYFSAVQLHEARLSFFRLVVAGREDRSTRRQNHADDRRGQPPPGFRSGQGEQQDEASQAKAHLIVTVDVADVLCLMDAFLEGWTWLYLEFGSRKSGILFLGPL